jgi:hypothetical protein
MSAKVAHSHVRTNTFADMRMLPGYMEEGASQAKTQEAAE